MSKKTSTSNSVVTIRFSGDSGDGMQLTGNQQTRKHHSTFTDKNNQR